MNDMINLKIEDRQGKIHQLQAPIDMNMNLMEFCKVAELPVEGTCGGMALCASCHIYVKSSHELQPAKDEELDMLDQAFFVKNNSRLACQIRLTAELEGLEITLAAV